MRLSHPFAVRSSPKRWLLAGLAGLTLTAPAVSNPSIERSVDSRGQPTITIKGTETPPAAPMRPQDRVPKEPEFQVFDLEVPSNQPKLPSWKDREPKPKPPVVVSTPPPIPSNAGAWIPNWGWNGYPIGRFGPNAWGPGPAFYGPVHGSHHVGPGPLRPINYQNRPINYQNRPINYQNRPLNYQNRPINYQLRAPMQGPFHRRW